MPSQKQKNQQPVEGQVVEALPNGFFRVRIEDSREILSHLSGKMRLHYIKVVVGDRVLIELSGYDDGRGRIIKRL